MEYICSFYGLIAILVHGNDKHVDDGEDENDNRTSNLKRRILEIKQDGRRDLVFMRHGDCFRCNNTGPYGLGESASEVQFACPKCLDLELSFIEHFGLVDDVHESCDKCSKVVKANELSFSKFDLDSFESHHCCLSCCSNIHSNEQLKIKTMTSLRSLNQFLQRTVAENFIEGAFDYIKSPFKVFSHHVRQTRLNNFGLSAEQAVAAKLGFSTLITVMLLIKAIRDYYSLNNDPENVEKKKHLRSNIITFSGLLLVMNFTTDEILLHATGNSDVAKPAPSRLRVVPSGHVKTSRADMTDNIKLEFFLDGDECTSKRRVISIPAEDVFMYRYITTSDSQPEGRNIMDDCQFGWSIDLNKLKPFCVPDEVSINYFQNLVCSKVDCMPKGKMNSTAFVAWYLCYYAGVPLHEWNIGGEKSTDGFSPQPKAEVEGFILESFDKIVKMFLSVAETAGGGDWSKSVHKFATMVRDMKTLKDDKLILGFVTNIVNWISVKVFGLNPPFVDQVQKLSESLKEFVKSSNRFMGVDDSTILADKSNLSKLSELCSMCNEIDAELIINRQVNFETSLYSKASSRIRSLHAFAKKFFKDSFIRQAPVVIMFSGVPGTGKSVTMSRMTVDVHKYHQEMKTPGWDLDCQKSQFSWPTKYWDGYSDQRILNMSEAFQNQDPQVRAEEMTLFIKIADNVEVLAQMANLEQKNTITICPEYIFMTTNVMGKIDGNIADADAVMRRIDFQIDTVKNPRYVEGGDEEYSLFQVYRWVRNPNDVDVISKWIRKPLICNANGTAKDLHYEELFALIINRYDEKANMTKLYKGDGSIGKKFAIMKQKGINVVESQDHKIVPVSSEVKRDAAANDNFNLLCSIRKELKTSLDRKEAIQEIQSKIDTLKSIIGNARALDRDRKEAERLASVLSLVPTRTNVGMCSCSTLTCKCGHVEKIRNLDEILDKLAALVGAKAEGLIEDINNGFLYEDKVVSFGYFSILALFFVSVAYTTISCVKPFWDLIKVFFKFVSGGSAKRLVETAELIGSEENVSIAKQAMLIINRDNFDQLKNQLTVAQRVMSFVGFYYGAAADVYNDTIKSVKEIWDNPKFKKLLMFSSVVVGTGFIAKTVWDAYHSAIAESEPAKDRKSDYKQDKYGLSDKDEAKLEQMYKRNAKLEKAAYDYVINEKAHRNFGRYSDEALELRKKDIFDELNYINTGGGSGFSHVIGRDSFRVLELLDELEQIEHLRAGGRGAFSEAESLEQLSMDLYQFRTSLYAIAITTKSVNGTPKTSRMNCVALDTKHLMMPAHLFDGLQVFGRKIEDCDLSPIDGKWMTLYRIDKTGVKSIDIAMPLNSIKVYNDTGMGDDIAVVTVNGWTPFPIISPVIDESLIPKIPTEGLIIRIDGVQANHFTARKLKNLTIGDRVEFFNGVRKHFIRSTLQYSLVDGNSAPGDCGSLIVAKIQNQYKVLGFHSFGQNTNSKNNAYSGGFFLTKKTRDDLISKCGGFVPKAEVEDYINSLEEIPGGCVRNFRVPKEDMVHTPLKTSLAPSPLHGLLTEKAYDVNEPALRDDCRAKVIKVINEKMSSMSTDFVNPEDVKFGVETCLHALPPSCFTDNGVGVGDVLPMHEALNSLSHLSAIDKTTSAGKEVHDLGLGSGKHPYLVLNDDNTIKGLIPEVQEMVDSLHNDFLRGVLVPSINHMFVKDETLPKEKDKIRLIQVLNLAYVALGRQVFGLYLSKFNELQPISYSAVGIDPHSREWDQMAKSLVKYSKDIVAGDISSNDYTETFPVIDGNITLTNTYLSQGNFNPDRFSYTCQFYGLPVGSSPEEVKRVANRYRECFILSVILGYKQIFDVLEWTAGQVPTGWWMTAQFNSTGTAIKNYAACGRICNMSPYETAKSFTMKVFGDDHLIGFNNDKAKMVTLPKFIEKYDELFHMKVTASDKGEVKYESRPITSEIFLGRGFLLRDNRYYAPRKILDMYDSLRWIKKGNDKEFSSTLISFLHDLKEYGRNIYEFHYAKLLKYLDEVGYVPVDPINGQPVVLPSYDFIVENSDDLHNVRLPTYAVAEMETINVKAVDVEDGVKNVVSLPGTAIEHGVQLTSYDNLESDGNDGNIPHLKRRTLAAQFNITTSTGRATVCTVDMFATILSNSYLAKLIAGHRYANVTFVARVAISSNRYCGGYMGLTYSPGDYYDTTTQGLDPVANTGWVSTLMDYSKDTEIEIEIPYFGPVPAIDIINYQPGQMGNLVIDNLAPLFSVSGSTLDSISVSVYVSIKKIHLYSKCADPLPTFSSGVRGPRAEMESVIKSAKGVVVGVANDATHWFGSTVTRAVSALTNDDIGERTGNLAESLVNFGRKKLFGFDKPLDVSISVKNFVPTVLPGSSNGDGLDFTTNLTTHHLQQDGHNHSLVDRGMSDDMSLVELSKIPSLLTTFAWSTADIPGTVIGTLYVNPKWVVSSATTTAGYSFIPTILSTVSTPFNNWKGDLNYKMKVGCTNFHSGRLRLVYSPLSTNVGESCNKAFYDVRGSTDINYSLPFPHNKPWANQSVGVITVIVENQLVCSGGAVNSSVPILIYVNGTNMCYANYSGRYFVPDEMVQLAPSAEGIREDFAKPFDPLVDEMKSVHVDGYALETVNHLGDVLKRPQAELNGSDGLNPLTPTGSTYIYAGPIRTGKVYYASSGGTSANLVFPTLGTTPLTPVRPTLMSHYATMFSYYRGSISYKILLNNNLGATTPYLGAVDRNQINATLVPGYIRHLIDQAFASNGVVLNTDQYPTLITTKYEGNLLATVPSNSNSMLIPTGRPVIDDDMWPYGLCISSGVGSNTTLERTLFSAADDFRFYYPRSSGLVRAVCANDAPGTTNLYYFYDPSVLTRTFG